MVGMRQLSQAILGARVKVEGMDISATPQGP